MIKRKRETAAAIIAGLFLSFGIALAYQHSNITERFEQQRQELQQRIQEQTEALKTHQEELRQQTQQVKELMPPVAPFREKLSPEQIQERTRERIKLFEQERQRMLQEVQKRKEEFDARAREMRETALQETEKRQQEFRERVSQIQEERLSVLTERLSEQINRVNQNMSDAALRYLDALELVLSKIEVRTGIVEDAAGVDLAQVKQEIASALLRIDEAREIVLAQKSKVYIMEIESQQTLGSDIRKAMQELRDDHRQLREQVLRPLRNLIRDVMLTMKDAVEQSEEEAAKVLHEEEPEEQQ